MASKSITIVSDGLHETFWNNIDSFSTQSSFSINDIIRLLKNHNIILPEKPEIPDKSNDFVKIDDTLNMFNKETTTPSIFKNLMTQKILNFSPELTLFTDGSFYNGVTTYSVIKQISTSSYEVINEARLPDFTGIFTAEMAAIKSAITFAVQQARKTIICTDCLSASRALLNNRNNSYDNLIFPPNLQHPILILWIPSHIGISGNEFADNIAKNALNMTYATETPCFSKYLVNSFNALNSQPLSLQRRPKYNSSFTRYECILMARIRVGKALFNTRHYYERTEPPICSHCNIHLSIEHILRECPLSRLNEPFDVIIDCSIKTNLAKVRKCLLIHNIRDI